MMTFRIQRLSPPEAGFAKTSRPGMTYTESGERVSEPRQ